MSIHQIVSCDNCKQPARKETSQNTLREWILIKRQHYICEKTFGYQSSIVEPTKCSHFSSPYIVQSDSDSSNSRPHLQTKMIKIKQLTTSSNLSSSVIYASKFATSVGANGNENGNFLPISSISSPLCACKASNRRRFITRSSVFWEWAWDRISIKRSANVHSSGEDKPSSFAVVARRISSNAGFLPSLTGRSFKTLPRKKLILEKKGSWIKSTYVFGFLLLKRNRKWVRIVTREIESLLYLRFTTFCGPEFEVGSEMKKKMCVFYKILQLLLVKKEIKSISLTILRSNMWNVRRKATEKE